MGSSLFPTGALADVSDFTTSVKYSCGRVKELLSQVEYQRQNSGNLLSDCLQFILCSVIRKKLGKLRGEEFADTILMRVDL